MIYAFAWKEGWVKVGWASDPMQRSSEGFSENSHPKELCGLLCPPHFQLLGLWEGTPEEGIALHEQWNEGFLSRKDCYNEFHEVSEWSKISRELCTSHKPLHLLTDFPPPSGKEKSRKPCCGGRPYFCKHCPKTFNWIRHVKAVHKRQRTK